MLKKTIRRKGALLVALAAMMLLAGCGTGLKRQDSISETDYEESQFEDQEAEHQKAAAADDVSDDAETADTDDVSDDTQTAAMTEEESREAVESGTTFTLTEKGKAFLAKLCNEMDDFNADSTLDEKFWRDFLFNSYTGALSEDAETEQVYREDLGFEETVVKVSRQEAASYVKLVFGMELPDLTPSFEDMEKGQTAFYYKDGSYYIGVSSLPDYQYTYAESLSDSENNANLIVKYTIDFMGESNVGTVTFTVSPEDNENGFVVRAKKTEFEK